MDELNSRLHKAEENISIPKCAKEENVQNETRDVKEEIQTIQ